MYRMREASGLVRTDRFFGGLLNDLKRKKQFYFSDFLHGLHPQCISSFLFLYFACLAPIVAFGGLLGEATENRIATIESLISGIKCAVAIGDFNILSQIYCAHQVWFVAYSLDFFLDNLSSFWDQPVLSMCLRGSFTRCARTRIGTIFPSVCGLAFGWLLSLCFWLPLMRVHMSVT